MELLTCEKRLLTEVTAVPLLCLFPRLISGSSQQSLATLSSLISTRRTQALAAFAPSFRLPESEKLLKNFTVDVKAWRLCGGRWGPQKERKEDEEFDFGRGLGTI